VFKTLVFIVLTAVSLAACQSLTADTGDVFYIDNKLVDCVGVAPQKCMLIKQQGYGNWNFFYDQIEGFKYEPGYRYKLLVKVTPVENPPADASSLHYKLIRVLEKNK